MTALSIPEICRLAPVIPALTIADAAHAAPLARALSAGGLKALEVTLRTPAALDAIRAIVDAAPDAVVGAGALLTPEDVRAAKEAGARFGASPGCSERLLDTAADADLPMLPGVATPGEAMRAAERGLETLKFFPAEANGGAAALAAWASPLAALTFCPTSGITQQNARDYLALPNVLCVGGSWVVPKTALETQDWAQVEALSWAAAQIQR